MLCSSMNHAPQLLSCGVQSLDRVVDSVRDTFSRSCLSLPTLDVTLIVDDYLSEALQCSRSACAGSYALLKSSLLGLAQLMMS